MTLATHPQYHVRAVHCDHRADDEQIYEALKRATQPLTQAWAKLKQARRICIKFNQAWDPQTVPYFEGHYQQLVSEKVARATLRLLREETTADLLCTEISVFKRDRNPDPGPTFLLMPLLREFGVEFVDGDLPPHQAYPVPGGGLMFQRYTLAQRAVEVDAFISVQKMKNHRFMGVTLCLKNLFGMPPREPYGRARQYFHHLVRLPYVLADLGRIFDPVLNIVDALVSQAGSEWGGGEPRITDTLLAGDHVIATDACATHLMGHDPTSDWPTPPFHRDRNALLVAAESGFGTVKLDEIDFRSEVQERLAEFFVKETDPLSRILSWQRTMSEQALYYRDHQKDFWDKYAGEYILLQGFEVIWHAKTSDLPYSRRDLARRSLDQGIWLKYVDPEETEGERYEPYEWMLKRVKELEG